MSTVASTQHDSPGTRPLPVVHDAIPRDLREIDQWVLWRYEERGGKPTKVPYRVNGAKASSTDPQTWTTHDDVWTTYQAGGYSGIGLVLTETADIVGVDLDKCRDAESGTIEPWAVAIIERLQSYTEVSPSGCGIRIFLRATMPGARTRKGQIEIYGSGRYLTVTGHHVDGSPLTVEHRQAELDALHKETFGDGAGAHGNESSRHHANGAASVNGHTAGVSAASTNGHTAGVSAASVNLDDSEIIELASRATSGHKFRALWSGDTTGYNSASEADLALANMLAFWTGPDSSRIERLFGQSALANRDKAQRPDYLARTVAKAMEGRVEYFGSRATKLANTSRALTDLGNAERLVDQHGDDIRFCFPWKKWLVWDGQRWRIDDSGAIHRLAKQTVRAIYDEVRACDNDERRQKLAKWAASSERRAAIENMVSLAASERPISPDDLDTDHWLFNVQNGTIELKTGILREHRRSDWITKLAPVVYDPNAQCPVWISFLNRIFADNAEQISYLQRLLGYCLTGSVREKMFAVLHGGGDNGKTTFMSAVYNVFGNDYYATVDVSLLIKKLTPSHPTERAQLFKKRLVVTTETDSGQQLSEAAVKHLTGTDNVSCRRMHEDPWEFSPTHKLFVVGNHRPRVQGQDRAIWERIHLVPFGVTIEEQDQDKRFGEKLDAERSGILNWLIRGCLDWQANGLAKPSVIQAATEGYRADEDAIGLFISDCCVVGEQSFRCSASDLFGCFQQWAAKAKEHSDMTQRHLGKELTKRGFERFTNNGVYYRGIKLLSQDD